MKEGGSSDGGGATDDQMFPVDRDARRPPVRLGGDVCADHEPPMYEHLVALAPADRWDVSGV